MIYELLKLLELLILLKLTLPSRTVEISDGGRGDMSVYLYIHIFFKLYVVSVYVFYFIFLLVFLHRDEL